MALAKFLEDITDRFLEDADDRLNGHLGRDWGSGWKATVEVESHAASLVDENGFLWDDRMVFVCGDERVCRVRIAVNGAKVALKWNGRVDAPQPQIIAQENQIRFLSRVSQSGDLHLECGNFSKKYRVSFVHSEPPETLPDFAKELTSLVDSPVEWTQFTFDDFRLKCDDLLAAYQLPQDFCDGVREYFLGIYHEQLNEPHFTKRLEYALTLLTPFFPYSRLAILIGGYIFYRMNAFEVGPVRSGLIRIGQLARFFSSDDIDPIKLKQSSITGSQEPLVISSIDQAIIEAIEFLVESKVNDAEKSLNHAELRRCPVDQHAQERIYFVRAKIAQQRGMSLDASRYAGLLVNSSVPSFQKFAKSFSTLS